MQRRHLMIGLAAGASGLLSACAEGYFFQANQLRYDTPEQLGVIARDVFFGSARGPRLHGWWLPAVGPVRATVVHAHGNAANVSAHLSLIAWLPAAGVEVLSFDYRGFGRSQGRPTLDGIVADTRAALGEARRRRSPTRAPLVLLGQSLGGATAIRALAEETAAGERDIALLVSDSAFASYRGIAQDITRGSLLGWFTPLAVRNLPPLNRDPLAAIAHIQAPVLLLHGDHDDVIPIQHGERLYAAANGAKQFVRITGGQHIDALTRADIRARVLSTMDGLRLT